MGVFSQALEGIGTIFGAAKAFSKGAIPLSKGVKSITLDSLEGKFPGVNKRLRTAGIGLSASTAIAGFGGVGPLSGISEEYERGMTSHYGDTESTQRVMAAQRSAAVGLAGVVGIASLAAPFKKGPLSSEFYSGIAKSAVGGGKIAARGVRDLAARGVRDLKDEAKILPDRIKHKANSAYNAFRYSVDRKMYSYYPSYKAAVKNIPKWQGPVGVNRGVNRGREASLKSYTKAHHKEVKKAKEKVRKIETAERFAPVYGPRPLKSTQKAKSFASSAPKSVLHSIVNNPMKTGLVAGAIMGLGAEAYYQSTPRNTGLEGNIEAIDSSGGISSELEASTQNLVFGLHRNNRSMRARYQ